MRILKQKIQIILILGFALFCSGKTLAQTYTGSVTFGNANQYSFDFTIECDALGTSADLTVTFTTSLPPGLVPQLHLGGGVFVSMSGGNPYTYTLSGLTLCDFNFWFYMAYAAGGLYQSPEPLNPGNTALPIFLSSFNVTAHSASASALRWTSATEINSDHFRIERSSDGLTWEYLGELPAAGNSSSSISYFFLDDNYPELRDAISVLYYRLKMVDLDGTFEYSEIRALNIKGDSDDEINIYPNPVYDELFIDLTRIDNNDGAIELGLYSPDGKLLRFEQLEGGMFQVLNIEELPVSNYQLVFFRKGEIIHQNRLIKTD